MAKLGERTLWIDCDVMQADGGTRTAAVTGAYVALALALRKGFSQGGRTGRYAPSRGDQRRHRATGFRCSISRTTRTVAPHVDMNVFMTDAGEFVEVQGTAEAHPFDRNDLDAMLDLAETGIRELFEVQKAAIAAESRSCRLTRRSPRSWRTLAEFRITDRAMKRGAEDVERRSLRASRRRRSATRYSSAVRHYFGLRT